MAFQMYSLSVGSCFLFVFCVPALKRWYVVKGCKETVLAIALHLTSHHNPPSVSALCNVADTWRTTVDMAYDCTHERFTFEVWSGHAKRTVEKSTYVTVSISWDSQNTSLNRFNREKTLPRLDWRQARIRGFQVTQKVNTVHCHMVPVIVSKINSLMPDTAIVAVLSAPVFAVQNIIIEQTTVEYTNIIWLKNVFVLSLQSHFS